MKKFGSFFQVLPLSGLVLLLSGLLFVASCGREFGAEPEPITSPMSRADIAVSSKAYKLFIVDIIKFQQQVKARYAELTEDDRAKIKAHTIDFQRATNEVDKNNIINNLENLLEIDFDTMSKVFSEHAPKLTPLISDISERELMLSTNKLLMTSRKKHKVFTLTRTETGTDPEMDAALREYDALIAQMQADIKECEYTEETRATGKQCLCAIKCTAESTIIVAGCVALTGPAAPVCVAAAMVWLVACNADCFM